MAYNVYFACDGCGDTGLAWTGVTVNVSRATMYARKRGWQVGEKGWFCPHCKMRLREEKRREAKNGKSEK